jgi:glutathione-independent formaldehyde dehydrogenase
VVRRRIEDVPDPVISEPTDVIVRITTTNICGSDLHMYEGRTGMETGRVLGHENLGEVVDKGSAVTSVAVGDRVCLPFNISCGFCRNCEKGLTAFCLTTNPDPDMVGAAYGFASMGALRRARCGPASSRCSCAGPARTIRLASHCG